MVPEAPAASGETVCVEAVAPVALCGSWCLRAGQL